MYWVTDSDRAFRQDLRAQSAAMAQALDDLASGQALQVIAWLAQANAAGFHIANLEIASHQMIQRHAARDQVAPRLARSQFDVVLALQASIASASISVSSRSGSGLKKFPAQSVAVAFQARRREWREPHSRDASVQSRRERCR